MALILGALGQRKDRTKGLASAALCVCLIDIIAVIIVLAI
ncbi:MAG: hypothetical protein RBG13Loki_0877 [Promethearchaeota archaeon CR_4]|nr:MAG: hypothetical protein RBG13Loki_0877 [Candidatus Lokiarchaeota archaeon CR_4]